MQLKLAYGYYRLSNEEAVAEGERKNGESGSIGNQRDIVGDYCKRNGYTLVGEFVDDGWSGGNYDRPGFKSMMKELEHGKANMVITKDLSRLGRDMRESSYYAEQVFPEMGVRYIAILDNFDSEQENYMAPFQFAMNEMYLRDCSRKVKNVLNNKRQNGQYCACAPYGYRKNPEDEHHLIPDELTAPIVRRIFERAASGDSSRRIAFDLNDDGIVPPLKHRVLNGGQFSAKGAARAADEWNKTTVKRILKNRVYLGHTQLGKSRKVSVKSDKKVAVPMDDWVVTANTHPPLVSETMFRLAQENMGRGTRDFRQYDHVRKSIFGGIAVCGRCGHALCSCGTVYKGEREKYWYLSCTHHRKDYAEPCEGVRIRYEDLVEVVKTDLNSLLVLTEADINKIVCACIEDRRDEARLAAEKREREKARARLLTIDKIVTKLYADNAEGKLDDDRLRRMVEDLEKESDGLKNRLAQLDANDAENIEDSFSKFYKLAQEYRHIETLDRQALATFVERIEVGPKVYPEGVQKITHRDQPFEQSIHIYYRFIGEVNRDAVSTKNQMFPS